MQKLEEFSIAKSTVECYKIRHSSGMYWADITIDTAPGSRQGRIQIASDYGDYQYYWGACGNSFKEFLTKLGIDYAASKFGADRWIDIDATVKSFKIDVIRNYRDYTLTKQEARELFDEIKELEENCCGGYDNDFNHYISNSDKLIEFYDYHPSAVHDITPQFKKFWNTCWQVFLNQIKSEETVPV